MGAAFAVRLAKGEEVLEGLRAVAKAEGLGAGSVVGIGAVEDVELGFYDLAAREYDRRVFREEHELVNLTGNFSRVDGEPFVHAHVTIGGRDYRARCGHLFRATCAVTCELVVTPLEGAIDRAYDDAVGLKLWCLEAPRA